MLTIISPYYYYYYYYYYSDQLYLLYFLSLQEALNGPKEVLDFVRMNYLDWTYQNEGLKAARKMYKRYISKFLFCSSCFVVESFKYTCLSIILFVFRYLALLNSFQFVFRPHPCIWGEHTIMKFWVPEISGLCVVFTILNI